MSETNHSPSARFMRNRPVGIADPRGTSTGRLVGVGVGVGVGVEVNEGFSTDGALAGMVVVGGIIGGWSAQARQASTASSSSGLDEGRFTRASYGFRVVVR